MQDELNSLQQSKYNLEDWSSISLEFFVVDTIFTLCLLAHWYYLLIVEIQIVYQKRVLLQILFVARLSISSIYSTSKKRKIAHICQQNRRRANILYTDSNSSERVPGHLSQLGIDILTRYSPDLPMLAKLEQLLLAIYSTRSLQLIKVQ